MIHYGNFNCHCSIMNFIDIIYFKVYCLDYSIDCLDFEFHDQYHCNMFIIVSSFILSISTNYPYLD